MQIKLRTDVTTNLGCFVPHDLSNANSLAQNNVQNSVKLEMYDNLMEEVVRIHKQKPEES